MAMPPPPRGRGEKCRPRGRGRVERGLNRKLRTCLPQPTHRPIIFIGMAKEPLPFRLSGPMALRLIREIAQDSSRVVVTTHARKRMLQRRINRAQVLEGLL